MNDAKQPLPDILWINGRLYTPESVPQTPAQIGERTYLPTPEEEPLHEGRAGRNARLIRAGGEK